MNTDSDYESARAAYALLTAPEAFGPIDTLCTFEPAHGGILRAGESSVALGKLRGKARRKVAKCEGCDLCITMPDGPMPFDKGALIGGHGKAGATRTAKWVLIGDMPNPESVSRGAHHIGKVGRLIVRTCQEVGLDLNLAYYGNVLGCTAHDPGRRKPRRPNKDEMMACRGNLIAQIEASGATCVLLAGADALHAFRPDLKVGRNGGRGFIWHLPFGDVMVMACQHPASVIQNRELRDQFEYEVRLFAHMVEHGPSITYLDDRCVECEAYAQNYDKDGCGYCHAHWVEGEWAWKRAREYWGELEAIGRIRGGARTKLAKGKKAPEEWGSLDLDD